MTLGEKKLTKRITIEGSNKMYQIELNFLPIKNQFSFSAYRSIAPLNDRRESPEERQYRLPVQVESNEKGWENYLVRFDPKDTYEPVKLNQNVDVSLTKWAVYEAIRRHGLSIFPSAKVYAPTDVFSRFISFTFMEHAEGSEQINFEPFFLEETKQFGVILNFHFRLRKGIAFSKKVQQLSLSLNSRFKRNLDYYIDRTKKVMSFLENYPTILSSVKIGEKEDYLIFEPHFKTLPADTFPSRTYIFGNKSHARTQFFGLKEHGPLQSPANQPHLLFAFRESDRPVARTLAMALRGLQSAKEQLGFSGFKTLFKTDISIDSNPVVLPDFSIASYQNILERVKTENRNVIPVITLPRADNNGYMIAKSIFAQAGIPCQICTLPVIQDTNCLKWSIANIALQIFCKSGGFPWKVMPTENSALIIGISQSHELVEKFGKKEIRRHFAFSILTDNSGLFQRIQILGEGAGQPEYLAQLRTNLESLLLENASSFKRVVIHTSFKLKKSEMSSIRETARAAYHKLNKKCLFSVIKVNQKTDFFGVNRQVNSLVPFETTRVKIGKRRHLIWFEGMSSDKPIVTKAFPGPTSVEFLDIGDDINDDDEMLRDLVNLSGANWRGFNAKSAPISVFYCHLVAEFIRAFREQKLPVAEVANIRPWFL